EDGILVNQHESPYYEGDRAAMQRSHKLIKSIFPISKVYQAHIPTYPSGHWCFGFASRTLDPIEDLKAEEWKRFNLETRYYNTELHAGAFYLPTYVKELLEKC
ncbi:MAG TPA: spermidine synthase, partial [Clostridia bacterium]|nr:spermidine synthase [Clostridia bacterium]